MNVTLRSLLIVILAAAWGCSAISGGSSEGESGLTAEQETVYSIGWDLGHQLRNYHLTPEETDLLASGLADSVAGRPSQVRLEPSGRHAFSLEIQRMAVAAAPERNASREFVAAEAERLGIQPTSSGLVFESVHAGSGPSAERASTVTVAYEMRKRDGAVVQSSGERPATFPLSSPGVLPCMREGLSRMRVGDKSRFVCPPELAYGDRSYGSRIPAGSALVVDAELIAIDKPAPRPGH